MPPPIITAAFVVLIVVGVAIWLRRTNRMAGLSGFLALPSTRLGRASALLFLVAVVFLTLKSTVFASVSSSVGSFNVGPAIGVLILLAAVVTGAIALIRHGERSWAVWLATLLPAIVIGAELISLLIPGE